MQKFIIKIISIFTVLSFVGCSVAPDYQQPNVILSGNYKEAPDGWKLAADKSSFENEAWWEEFNDPVLNQLETKLEVSNLNIVQAIAQYQQALALIEETEAGYWPTIMLSPSASRQKASVSTASNSSSKAVPTNSFQLEPSASWSPDIFGVVGLAVDASRLGAQASAAQLAATRLSTQALLAQTYFRLRALDADQKLLNDTVVAYRKAFELTKNRYAVGVASRLDIIQADTQLQTAIVAGIDNGINRAQYEHAIAVLIGEAPANFSLSSKVLDFNPPNIPFELPSALLERRPDIAQAECLVAQANANIGIANSAYFPILTLSGVDGYSSYKLSKLFTHPARVWSVGAVLAETLFDGGARAAKAEYARAAYDQSVATYKQTVLTALQQVEDNLVALRILTSEMSAQAQAVKSAELALNITLNEYKAGTVAYSNVITAQATAYAAKKTEADIYSRRMVAAVSLIQALGGGWQGI